MNRSPEIRKFLSVVGFQPHQGQQKVFRVQSCNNFNRNTSLELAISTGLPENDQNFFGVGGFSCGLVGLQETAIFFCPAL